MAETVEVPKALIEALAERCAASHYFSPEERAIIALLPPTPPTFTDAECLAFFRAMWPPSSRLASGADWEAAEGRRFLTRLHAAGLKVVPVDG